MAHHISSNRPSGILHRYWFGFLVFLLVVSAVAQAQTCTVEERIEYILEKKSDAEIVGLCSSLYMVPPKGKLSVSSSPPNAEVFLDLDYIGKTPLVQYELEQGTHQVELRSESHQSITHSMDISGGTNTSVFFSLKEKPPSLFYVKVLPHPLYAHITILNIQKPFRQGIQLPPGEYQMEVTASGFVKQKLWVRIEDSDLKVVVQLTENPEPLPAHRLKIRTVPEGARIRILNLEQKLREGILLEKGEYQLKVSKLGYSTKNETIRISKEDVTRHVNLGKDIGKKTKDWFQSLTGGD